MPFYESHLWYNYSKYNFRRVRVAYNGSYKTFHHIPRCVNAYTHQVRSSIKTINALIRNVFFLS